MEDEDTTSVRGGDTMLRKFLPRSADEVFFLQRPVFVDNRGKMGRWSVALKPRLVGFLALISRSLS
jgi:hypothetical protein